MPNNQNGLQTVNIAWVFDAQGKLLEPAAAKQAYYHGQGPLQGHFSQDDMPSLNDIQMGLSSDKVESLSVVLITANIQSTQNLDPNAPFAVVNLTVAINDGRMYVPAIEATRAKALEAADAKRAKDAEELKKRGAPGL